MFEDWNGRNYEKEEIETIDHHLEGTDGGENRGQGNSNFGLNLLLEERRTNPRGTDGLTGRIIGLYGLSDNKETGLSLAEDKMDP